MMSFVKSLLLILIASFFSTNVVGQSTEFVIKKTGPDYYLEHKVQPKENWFSVGRVYLISPRIISTFNNLSMDKGLSIGQLIRIPLTADNFNQSDNAAFTGPAIVHTVAQGEGLLRLANVYKVTMEQLRKWNRLSTDQLKVNSNLIIGFLQTPDAGDIQPAASAAKVSQGANPVAPQSNTRKSDESAKTVVPAPIQTQQTTTVAQPKPVQPATKQTPAAVNQTANVGANAGIGYFASLFTTQSKEGKQQKMETPAYGVFKSTSGWQDGKYYVLMNSVVPGTVVQITSKNTGKQLYAKVLGAVPPGKESEGLLLRISNAAASALGVPNGESGVFELVWSN
jgi:LysM repeat protein